MDQSSEPSRVILLHYKQLIGPDTSVSYLSLNPADKRAGWLFWAVHVQITSGVGLCSK